MGITTTDRLWLAVGAVVAVVGLVLLVLPVTADDGARECGSVLAPKNTDTFSLDPVDDVIGDVFAKIACDDARSERRGQGLTLAGLGGFAVVVVVLNANRGGKPDSVPAPPSDDGGVPY